ncbi:MAG: Ig-like domain-containing protein [Actinomycetia bacterium]|nr:Ig-like domain-containing protein [Actinomycetes bacterium]
MVVIRRFGVVLLVAGLTLAGFTAAGGTASATTTPVTYQDALYNTASAAPTADKPQSKLWYNDGSWWALMMGASTVNIYQLQANHTWRDTGTVVDDRVNSTGDALWSNGHLYVASRTAGSAGAIRIYRFTYSSATKSYARDSGFPVKFSGGGSESVTIDRDSLGRLWITFTRGSKVWVAHSTTADNVWVKPFLIPGVDTSVATDDISALISMGDKIGVLWSDQASAVLRFAVHIDTAPDSSWTSEVPLSGFDVPDDHLNLKSLLGDDQGRVHAAIKTSQGDHGQPGTTPLIYVLSRTSGGVWSAVPESTVADGQTRPQLALDRTNHQLIVMTSDEGGGNVYYKTTPLNDIAFGPGKGAPFISWSGASVNNVSTTKDPVDSTTGLVAIASDEVAHRYYHAEMSLGPATETVPPTVTVTSPADGASGVAATVTPAATFSEAMDASTINGTSVTLSGPSGAVAASVGYNSTSFVATLTPSAPLATGASYTATVSTGVKDVAGNAMSNSVSWTFATSAATETVPPTVTATSPTNGSTGVASTATPTVTFSEAMDASTVNGTSVTLSGPSGAVVASVGYNSTSFMATLTPSAPLAAGASYTATVSTGVKDVAGNAMSNSVSWSFTTAGSTVSTVVLTPIADSYVSSGAASTNFGTATQLQVDGSPLLKSYLKFDLSSYAGRTIESATLTVPVTTSGSIGKQNVRLTLKDTWTETGITSSNAPGLDTVIGVLGPTSAATTYSVPLTASYIGPKLGGLLSLGIASTSDDDVVSGSRESSTPIQLKIVFQP